MQFDNNNRKYVLLIAVLFIALGIATIFWDIKIGLTNMIAGVVMLYLSVASLKAYRQNNSKLQLIVTYIYFFVFLMNIFSGIFLAWLSNQGLELESNVINNIENILVMSENNKIIDLIK